MEWFWRNKSLKFSKGLWYECSRRKIGLQRQASSEHADAQSRHQVSREMLLVHWQAWICLSIVTHEYTLTTKRFPPKTVNEKKFLSSQSVTFVFTKNQPDYWHILFQHCVSKSADGLLLFLLFSRKMDGNIKVKLQTNGVIAIDQGDSTVTIHPLKMRA